MSGRVHCVPGRVRTLSGHTVDASGHTADASGRKMNVYNYFQTDLQHVEAQDLLQIATQEMYDYLGEFAAPDL